jgi:polyhydroxybutyrate depolymerase
MNTLIFCLLLPFISIAQDPAVKQVPRCTTSEHTLLHQGLSRKYTLYVPSAYKTKKPIPLVLVLHGQTGRGLQVMRLGSWGKKAEEEGFIVAAPDATGDPSAWNSGYNNGRNYPVDDLAFMRELLDHLEGRFNIDKKRIYACGMSSGAMMSHKVGAELSERIAAIGPVAGSIGAKLKDRGGQVVQIPPPKSPVSVIAIHGKADKSVPYEGSQNRVMNFLPVSDSIAFWVKHDGCDRMSRKKVSAEGNLIEEVYSSGKDGTEVVLYTIENAAHIWPRTNGQDPQPIDATDVIWDFFVKHPKK